MIAALIAINLAVWASAWAAFGDRPALLGTALLAWVFGLRHAFDADHIAAIDNVVRKLIADNQKPEAVGLYFSLGHSTVVVLASVAVMAATGSLQDRLEVTKNFGGVIGTAVSALFLLSIAMANMIILRGLWRSFAKARRTGRLDESELTGLLAGRGFLTRMLAPVFRSIRRSWHMYPLGFLFGLGFDTATEIALLGIAAAESAHGLPAWQTMLFPALFTAGMALVDTADSILMAGAYGWALIHPVRKLWYNLTITAASILVALLIGGLEALGLIADRLRPAGWFWDQIGMLNDNLTRFGVAIVGLFVVCWVASAALYRWRRFGDIEIESI